MMVWLRGKDIEDSVASALLPLVACSGVASCCDLKMVKYVKGLQLTTGPIYGGCGSASPSYTFP
jgi:hypothetical protein